MSSFLKEIQTTFETSRFDTNVLLNEYLGSEKLLSRAHKCQFQFEFDFPKLNRLAPDFEHHLQARLAELQRDGFELVYYNNDNEGRIVYGTIAWISPKSGLAKECYDIAKHAERKVAYIIISQLPVITRDRIRHWARKGKSSKIFRWKGIPRHLDTSPDAVVVAINELMRPWKEQGFGYSVFAHYFVFYIAENRAKHVE